MRTPEPDCWLHPELVLRASPIAGTGWHATATIPADATVSRLGGTLVSTAELRELLDTAGRDERGYVDTVVVTDDLHLVLPDGTANHYGNHSCDPNLGWTDEYTLVAIRDVAPGEELTSDYATSTLDPQFLLRCHCQTYRCRQMVTGDDWRIPQLQRRYAGRWTPYLQRHIELSTAR